jgi:hypothetical protein
VVVVDGRVVSGEPADVAGIGLLRQRRDVGRRAAAERLLFTPFAPEENWELDGGGEVVAAGRVTN